MILVSFFSEDNVLSDYYIFEYQTNENRAFPFFWDTRYNDQQILDSGLLESLVPIHGMLFKTVA